MPKCSSARIGLKKGTPHNPSPRGIAQAQGQKNPSTGRGAQAESNPSEKKGTGSFRSNNHLKNLKLPRVSALPIHFPD
uniref:Uncharacterized protein n=1 Tax=Arundo donax TaxID=35708 RepID=A0A0A9B9S0_ARUDO